MRNHQITSSPLGGAEESVRLLLTKPKKPLCPRFCSRGFFTCHDLRLGYSSALVNRSVMLYSLYYSSWMCLSCAVRFFSIRLVVSKISAFKQKTLQFYYIEPEKKTSTESSKYKNLLSEIFFYIFSKSATVILKLRGYGLFERYTAVTERKGHKKEHGRVLVSKSLDDFPTTKKNKSHTETNRNIINYGE